jgi:hypothetical protein
VVDGVTGLLFERQTAADVVAAIKACERLDTPPEQIAQSVARFSRVGFREGIVRAIADARREVRREPNHELTGVAP